VVYKISALHHNMIIVTKDQRYPSDVMSNND